MTKKSIQDNASYRQLSFPYIYGENIEHLYPNVTLSIERITPEIAEKMLTTNVKNRKIKISHLEMVKETINSDEWTLNGESIVFDEFGKLSDGQHRLMACVKTGKPIVVVVVRGVDEEAQDTIDNNTKRSLADYVNLDGYKNCNDVASVGKALIRKDDLGFVVSLFDNNITKRSIKAMRKFINDCYDKRIDPLISPIKLVQSKYGSIPSKVLAVLFDEFRKSGDEDFNEFVNQLVGKSAACMPVRLLQQKLIDNNKSKTAHSGAYKNSVIAAYIIKAWNAYIRGDEMQRLVYNPGGKNPERFPEIFLGYE